MKIESGYKDPHQVVDYEFTFHNGLTWSTTIDPTIGDTVDFDSSPGQVVIKFVEKPSKTDHTTKVPPETNTLFMSHILMIRKCERTIIPMTPDQLDEFQKSLFRMSNTPNQS